MMFSAFGNYPQWIDSALLGMFAFFLFWGMLTFGDYLSMKIDKEKLKKFWKKVWPYFCLSVYCIFTILFIIDVIFFSSDYLSYIYRLI